MAVELAIRVVQQHVIDQLFAPSSDDSGVNGGRATRAGLPGCTHMVSLENIFVDDLCVSKVLSDKC